MTDDEAPSPDGEVCCECGVGSEQADLSYDPDPYQEEMNGNDTPVWMCSECRYESAMEL